MIFRKIGIKAALVLSMGLVAWSTPADDQSLGQCNVWHCEYFEGGCLDYHSINVYCSFECSTNYFSHQCNEHYDCGPGHIRVYCWGED